MENVVGTEAETVVDAADAVAEGAIEDADGVMAAAEIAVAAGKAAIATSFPATTSGRWDAKATAKCCGFLPQLFDPECHPKTLQGWADILNNILYC